MSDAPYISVIMPVYNAEKYVGQAIESILKQGFTDFEFLIFNDASTDASREIILSFKDERIIFIDSPVNTGYVKYLNDGLAMARGKYIARMDADDISMPDRFQQQVNYLDVHEEVVVCGSFIECIGERKGVVTFPLQHRDIITHLLLHGNGMAHPSVMMRKSVWDQYTIQYDRSLEPAEDYDVWVRLADYGQLHNLDQVLLQYRVHDANESVVKKEKQDRAVFCIRKKMISRWVEDGEEEILRALSSIDTKAVIDQCVLPRLVEFAENTHRSKLYNNVSISEKLVPVFVAYCKQSERSAYEKLKYYLRLPKSRFSVRTCLSILFKR
jgi:glycosyltransferase involved in cell wall biosynthesis